MKNWTSKRIQSIGSYAFAEVDKKVQELKERGIEPIDFGVGDPTVPTPEHIRCAAKQGIDTKKSSGYPSYIGNSSFREAVAQWVKVRFGLEMDPQNQITSTSGSKEGVFNFHEGVINPGDYVLCPSPGYPPYTRGTLFAEGIPYQVPLLKNNGFLIDFSQIPDKIAGKTKLMWLNYPNSPSGAMADEKFYREAYNFARKHDIIIASDEAYSEIYFTDRAPLSFLNVAEEGVIVFNSLSKRSAMTGYRIGWAMGDPELISIFKKVKTNIDSGTPDFIQEGAIAALSNEKHVQNFRRQYREKRDILCNALSAAGLEDCTPESTLYIWQRVPAGYTSLEFAALLLQKETAIVTTPGAWISQETETGINAGEGYIRFALVPSVEDTRQAAKRIRKLKY